MIMNSSTTFIYTIHQRLNRATINEYDSIISFQFDRRSILFYPLWNLFGEIFIEILTTMKERKKKNRRKL